jgi:hypothetical protein
MRLDLKPVTDLRAGERDALKVLTAAVYPPEVLTTRPGRFLQWAPSRGVSWCRRWRNSSSPTWGS